MDRTKPIYLSFYLIENTASKPADAELKGRGFKREQMFEHWSKQGPHSDATINFIIRLTKEFLS